MSSTAATIAKDKGNAAFKAGNWPDAIGHYSAAVLADRTEPVYPLNRAAAYLKLGKHRDAERDCTTVLSLDGKNVKALFRRAQARAALGSLADAENDLTAALRLEPVNNSVKAELAAVQKRKSEESKKRPCSNREPIAVPPLHSSSQHKPQTDTVPRRITRNVPIEIIEPDEEPKGSIGFLKPIQSRVLPPSNPSAGSPPAHKSQPRVGAGIFRADGSHTILRTPTSLSAPSPAPSPVSAPASPSASAVPASDTSASLSPPQLTHFAFSRTWHALPTPQERYSLLLHIPPETLPALFQNSLEPELLMSILRTFEAVTSPATTPTILTYMSAFPAVPRFRTVLLFLIPREKDLVRAVLTAIGHDEGRAAWGA